MIQQPDFKILFESAPGLFLVLLPDLTITAVSDAYLQATRTIREEIVGKGIFEIFPDNPDDPAATGVANLRASLMRVLATKNQDAMAAQKYDIQLPESEGGGFVEKHWSPINSPVLDKNNEITYIIHRAEDITDFIKMKQKGTELQSINQEMEVEIYRRAQQIQEANEQLRNAEKLKSEFFANVSHELRTPLSLILAPLESLLTEENKGNFSDKHIKYLHTTHNNALRLLQMVNGLLDFAKFEAGKMKVELELTDIADLINSMLNDFESAVKGKKIQLIIETNITNQYIMIDRYLFERIFFNLMSNAGKFTPEGGKITVRSEITPKGLIMSIEDTGIGIAEKDFEKLFQKFSQVEGSSTRRFEGTGLGLAMVKEFTELLGGKIQVESKVNIGTKFTITLNTKPIEADSGEVVKKIKKPVLVPRYQINKSEIENISSYENKMKVLVCEDNEELAEYITSLLEEYCEVKNVYTGTEGLQIINTWKPDLILSDVMMPVMDGITLCRNIKSNSETADITVVLLTALTHREAMLKGWEAKADEYLFKPFHPEELVTRIKSLLSVIAERKINKERIINLNESLLEKVNQLETVNKELEAFSYSVAHDLRAPIRAINGYMNIFLEDYSTSLNDEGNRLTQKVMDNVKEMGMLIDDLLSFFRTGKKDLIKIKVPMKKLASEVFEELREQEPDRNIEFQIADIPEIDADPPLIKQVWTNLISNAIKYSRQKNTANIEIGYTMQDGNTTYYIKDNGNGFDMQYYHKLFGIFERLHSQNEFEGTGIGLAIVQKIIFKHGGKVWAESKVNEGATFYFTLQ